MNGDDGAAAPSRAGHSRTPGATTGQHRPAPARRPIARNRRSLTWQTARRNAWSLALAAFLIPGLAACTDDPAPVGTVPGSSVTATSAAAVPEPTRPVEQPTPDSAIDFVRYFWALYNYAYQTYDTAPLEAISDASCKYCSSTVGDVRKISSAHTRVENFEIRLDDAASPPVKIMSRALVVAISTQEEGTATTANGVEHHLAGFKKKRFDFALAWKANEWSIHGVDFGNGRGGET